MWERQGFQDGQESDEMLSKRIVDYTLIDVCVAVGIIFSVVSVAIAVVMNFLISIPLDGSDLDATHRSGVSVVTDYGTHQQYLVTHQGGITPRLSKKD